MFHNPEIGFEIQDIVDGNTRYLDDLITLYSRLFPGYERYVAVMRRRAARPSRAVPPFIEHQWLALVNGQPAGMVVFKYNQKRNCGLGLDLGVHPDFRVITYKGHTRLAKLLIDLRHEQLILDASSLGDPMPIGSLVEVESPDVVAQFRKYGMQQLPVKYVEPPAPEDALELMDRREVDETAYKPMHLGIYPIDRERFDPKDPAQLSDLIRAYLVDHYGLPETHWAVRAALQSILTEESVK